MGSDIQPVTHSGLYIRLDSSYLKDDDILPLRTEVSIDHKIPDHGIQDHTKVIGLLDIGLIP